MNDMRFRGLDPCVHCGFCLQACPTFLATGDEADSPRGRIVLMQGLQRGTLDTDDPLLNEHLDRCLGCRACETACPAGVAYGESLEDARAVLAPKHPPSLPARVVLTVMAEAAIRRPFLALARALRPAARWLAGGSRLGFALASLAATRRRTPVRGAQAPATPRRTSPSSAPRGRTVVFRGCIMEGLFGHVHDASARTLEYNGYALDHAPAQGCCGALHAHAGRRDHAIALAAANVRAFREAPDATIAVNSAGCGAMLRAYGHLLADHPLARDAETFAARIRDVTEILAEAGPRPGALLPLRVAYDPPCHLHHAQRVVDPPERVLAAVPGLHRVHHARAESCCGSAGLYSLEQPALSRQVLATKIDAIVAAAPDVLVTGNPGCAMHIGAGLEIAGAHTRVMHPVELLDWSYGAVPADTEAADAQPSG